MTRHVLRIEIRTDHPEPFVLLRQSLDGARETIAAFPGMLRTQAGVPLLDHRGAMIGTVRLIEEEP